MKLTDWYPGILNPVRAGWYERQYNNGITFMDWWDSKWYWRTSPHSAECANQYLPWRGMVK